MESLYQVYGLCESIWQFTFWLYYPAVALLLFLVTKTTATPLAHLAKNWLAGFISFNSAIYLFMTTLSLVEGHPVAYGLLVFVGLAFIGSLVSLFQFAYRYRKSMSSIKKQQRRRD